MDRKRSIFYSVRSRSNGFSLLPEFQRTVLGSEYLVKRLKCEHVFVGHEGCVNTVAWNESGDMLLTGSDDCQLNMYRLSSMKPVQSISSGHRANIFSAKFLPCTGDTKIVSCSGDGVLHYNDVNSHSYGKSPFRCHSGTTYEVNTTPADPHSFLSSGEDGTVRFFDLRYKTKCLCEGCKDDVLIDCGNKAVTSFSVNPLYPYYIAVGCEDSMLRVYDRRSLSTEKDCNDKQNGLLYQFKPKSLGQRSCRVTSLNYSSDGQNLLASFSTDYVYLFDSKSKPLTQFQPEAKTSEERDGLGHHAGNDPPMKRLRLRGDWSDTGPNARPESEDTGSSDNTFIQRMSGYLTRWIQESMQNAERRTHDNNPSDARSRSDDTTERSIHRDENSDSLDVGDESEVQPAEVSESNHGTGDSNHDDVIQLDSHDDVIQLAEDNVCAEQDETPDDQGGLGQSHKETSESQQRHRQGSSEEHEEISRDKGESLEVQRGTLNVKTVSSEHYEESSDDDEESSEDNMGSSGDQENDSEDNEGSPVEPVTKNTPMECEACPKDAEYKNGGKTCSTVDNDVASAKCPGTVVSSSTDNKSTNPDASAILYRQRKRRTSKNTLLKSKATNIKTNNKVLNSRDTGGCTGISRNDEVDVERINRDIGNSKTTVGNSLAESTKPNPTSSNNPIRDIGDSGSDVTGTDIRTQSSGRQVGKQEGTEPSVQSPQTRTSAVSTSVSHGANVGESSGSDDSETRRNAAANVIQNFFRFRHQNNLTSRQHDVPIYSEAKQIYKGHRNARTMIKEANFWGDDFVLSGSDCGRIFIWSRHTGELVMLLEGDRHVVNCVQPHPFDPILATSGIDYDVKLWTPTTLSLSSLEGVNEVIARNEKMLRESRDTLTVPASFMIRVLSSLHRVRVHTVANDDDDDEDDD